MSVYRLAPVAPSEPAPPVVLRGVERPAAVAWSGGFAGLTIAFGVLGGLMAPAVGLMGLVPFVGVLHFTVAALRPSELRLDARGISGDHVVRVGRRRARRQRFSVAWRDLRAVHVDRMDSCLILHTAHDELQISLAGGAGRVQTAIIDYHDRLLREPRRRALEVEALRRALLSSPVRFTRSSPGFPRVVELRREGLAFERFLYAWEEVSSAHKIFVGERTGMVRVILKDGRAVDVDGRYDAPLDALAELIDPPFDKVEAARRLMRQGLELREAATRAGLPAA